MTVVDQRVDSGVAGPFIDTLLLAELLARDFWPRVHDGTLEIKAAMEVGSGSGMLAASILRHVPHLRLLLCWDTEPQAIMRTDRTLGHASTAPDSASNAKRFSILGSFAPELIARRFDLIVSNPPYIQAPPGAVGALPQFAKFFSAVTGTDVVSNQSTAPSRCLPLKARSS